MGDGQSGRSMSQGWDFPSMLHALGWATDHCFKGYAVLAPTQGDFFYVAFTEQALLTISGIPAYCGFHEYKGNSWHIPGPRNLKAPQWLKMWLNLSWRYVNCDSKSKTYSTCHSGKKIVLSWFSAWSFLKGNVYLTHFCHYTVKVWSDSVWHGAVVPSSSPYSGVPDLLRKLYQSGHPF